MICFMYLSARSSVPMSAGFSSKCFDITDLCRDYGFFSNPSLGAIPFDALQSVAILKIRSSPKSRVIDCMVIPILAPLTMPRY